jgi:hypothetical protein
MIGVLGYSRRISCAISKPLIRVGGQPTHGSLLIEYLALCAFGAAGRRPPRPIRQVQRRRGQ